MEMTIVRDLSVRSLQLTHLYLFSFDYISIAAPLQFHLLVVVSLVVLLLPLRLWQIHRARLGRHFAHFLPATAVRLAAVLSTNFVKSIERVQLCFSTHTGQIKLEHPVLNGAKQENMQAISSRLITTAKPHLKVPQVWLPEEGAHDVEVGRRLDDGRLPAAAAAAAAAEEAGADGGGQAAEGGEAAALVDEVAHHVVP